MSILSWGKPTIKHSTSTAGAPGTDWTKWPTPKEDTTKVTPTAGTKKTATEEGGETVDVRYGKNSYVFEFELFVKKGEQRPIEDNDGIIDGEHAFRIIPEDPTAEGSQIDCCRGHVEETFTAADGKMLKYVFDVMKPAEGKMVKPYTEGTGA